MKIKDTLTILEEMAPLGYAESFDNVGLLVGDAEANLTGILVCHDALVSVIEEAIAKACNLVVCFHPILFTGLKKITGKNYVEKAVIKAIKNDIAVYAVHTALDNDQNGVNKIFCDALGIKDSKVLIPKQHYIYKLVTYTIAENTEKLRNALFEAGAGQIGNYENCSFNSFGTGTYKGNANSNPFIGSPLEFKTNNEHKIEVLFEKHLQSKILKALYSNHVYEEVAYEIHALENEHQNIGLGRVGSLEKPLSELDFLALIRQKLDCKGIRHSQFTGNIIQKVAVLGGSGSYAIKNAIDSGADAYVTADLKYHQFYEAENKLLLADIGHFESEKFTKTYIVDYLKEKITNFAIILSQENTNPVKYF